MNDEIIKKLQEISAELAEIKQMLSARGNIAAASTAGMSKTIASSQEDKVFELEVYDGTMREWKSGMNAGKGAYVRVKLLEPYEGLSWASLGVRYVDGQPPICLQQAGNKVAVRGRINVREYNGRQDLTIFPSRNSFGGDDIWEVGGSETQTAPAEEKAAPAKKTTAKPSIDDDVPF
ncbi:MAG: hypothetical protein K6B46_04915 [Opitutales bacterium]|nr:hypothetical protein [Opitutales bacterium]